MTDEIERWDSLMFASMGCRKNGEWVKHSDHLAAMLDRDAEIARLTAALERTEENRDAILADLARLLSERDTARAETAMAFEVAAAAGEKHTECCQSCAGVGHRLRALTPAHATAALEVRDRQKLAQGLRLASQEALRCASDYPTSDGVELGCRRSSDAILALAASVEAGEEVGRG